MKRKTMIYSCIPVIATLAAGFSTTLYAEGGSMESANTGLAALEKAAESTQKTTEALKGVETSAVTSEVQGGLTETLVNKLGITTEQAEGGAGAIFQSAKGQLDEEQFAELSASVPEMDTLLKAAPEPSESLGGITDQASAVLGDDVKTYGNLAELASSFKELKLSPDMVDEFVPVVVDYVRTNGGASAANMLQSVLYGM